jgi:hypothetical protein
MERTKKPAAVVQKKVPAKRAITANTRLTKTGVTQAVVKAAKVVESTRIGKTREDKPVDKVIRASFTMRHSEYDKITELKQKCLNAGMRVKKSELVRAGLRVLATLEPAQLSKALEQMAQIKIGRPKKS